PSAMSGASPSCPTRRSSDFWVKEHFLGVVASEPQPLAVSAGEAARYAGRYRSPVVGQVYELLWTGDGLMLQVHPGDLSAVSSTPDRKSTRLNSSHVKSSYAV